MVNFRKFDIEKDKNQVISLINKNLNSSYSEENLFWKHYKNPYQISSGAVAIENSKIVACVFYMPYNVQLSNGKRIKAGRPVDGCTDLSHRGKGIFKKLMKYCLQEFKYDYEFLFANPNQYSFPEFLKMGWSQHHGYAYYWGLIRPLFSYKKSELTQIKYDTLPQNSENAGTSSEELEFVTWRFEYSKYKKILYKYGDTQIFLVYRVAKMKGIRTVIICYHLGSEKLLNTIILKACSKEKTSFVYFLVHKKNSEIKCIFKIKHKKAVIVTKPNIDMPENIRFTLADLEGTT